MSNDYKMSYKQRQRLRHGSISQTTQIFYGIQGETPRRLQDALATRRWGHIPDQHWVRHGATPPSWIIRRGGGPKVPDWLDLASDEPARVTHERRMERVREAHPDFPVRSEYPPEDRGVGGYLSDVTDFWNEHDDDCDCRKEAG